MKPCQDPALPELQMYAPSQPRKKISLGQCLMGVQRRGEHQGPRRRMGPHKARRRS
jgi:hypothetical protein